MCIRDGECVCVFTREWGVCVWKERECAHESMCVFEAMHGAMCVSGLMLMVQGGT